MFDDDRLYDVAVTFVHGIGDINAFVVQAA